MVFSWMETEARCVGNSGRVTSIPKAVNTAPTVMAPPRRRRPGWATAVNLRAVQGEVRLADKGWPDMQLKKYTDYSLRVLIFAGIHGERLVNISEISEKYGISRNHLVKVVHGLSTEGFLESVRGRGGGVRLAHRPEEIVVGDVVRAMEGEGELVECYKPLCPISPVCRLQGILAEGHQAYLTTLDRYTVADLVQNKPELLRHVG